MTKHRLNVFITLVIVLLIIAGILAWVTGESVSNPPAAEESETPTATETLPASSAKPTENSAKPEESAKPSKSPEESSAPESPKESEDPSIPKTRTLNTSGSFESSTGTNLNISVKWTAVSKNDQTVTLTATAYMYSYTMHYGSTSGTMSINGVSKNFVSNAINYDNSDRLQEVKLCTMTLDLPIAVGETVSIPVGATWNFNGTYNNQELSGISANEYILIEG